MTVEERKEWECIGCAVRVYDATGRPLPEPSKWEDGRCPRCRIDQARREEGSKAGQKLEERLIRGGRRKEFQRGRGTGQEKPDSPAADTSEIERALRETFDSDRKISADLGVNYFVVRDCRKLLGLDPGGERRMAKLREDVQRVVAEHPDWTNERVADAVGAKKKSVMTIRNELKLPKLRPGGQADAPAAA